MANFQDKKISERLKHEVGTIYKPHDGKLLVALSFPNTYHVGMSSLGFQTIYKILNKRDDTVCERVFLPDQVKQADGKDNQRLLSYESDCNIRDFDILAFSMSYEMDYHNLIKIMRLSGVKPLSSMRMIENDQPLVIAGGTAVTFNPEPLADFVDLFVIGEGEEVIDEIMNVIADNKDRSRTELLDKLSHIDGVYVPMFYHPLYDESGVFSGMDIDFGHPKMINRRWVSDIGLHPASTVITAPDTRFADMLLVEVARGCGRHCRFCAAGYTYLPSRPSDVNSVIDIIHRHESKSKRIGLMSASVFDHSQSCAICRSLIEEDYSFSISSTRADTLNDDVANLLREGNHKTITIAPEAGSDRLRNVINKIISRDDIFSAAESAWKNDFRRLKLYFMVGLPTETMQDIDCIIDLVSELSVLYNWHNIDVSVSCFVPKPFTPFQWVAMDSEKVLVRKLSHLKLGFQRMRKVQFHNESPREALIQGILARGDRKTGRAILAYADKNISWKAALKESDIDPLIYAERVRDEDEIFPWQHIDLGVSRKFLFNEYINAINGITTDGCGTGKCQNCGNCVDIKP